MIFKILPILILLFGTAICKNRDTVPSYSYKNLIYAGNAIRGFAAFDHVGKNNIIYVINRTELGYYFKPKISVGTAFNFSQLSSNLYSLSYLQHENSIFIKFHPLKKKRFNSLWLINQISIANSHFDFIDKEEKYFFAYTPGIGLNLIFNKTKFGFTMNCMANIPLKPNYSYPTIYFGSQPFRIEGFVGLIYFINK
ncbi:MAG: hypothetical protein V4667_06245 [Bacteroidota bacterium]